MMDQEIDDANSHVHRNWEHCVFHDLLIWIIKEMLAYIHGVFHDLLIWIIKEMLAYIHGVFHDLLIWIIKEMLAYMRWKDNQWFSHGFSTHACLHSSAMLRVRFFFFLSLFKCNKNIFKNYLILLLLYLT
jgi:hypothetical protein